MRKILTLTALALCLAGPASAQVVIATGVHPCKVRPTRPATMDPSDIWRAVSVDAFCQLQIATGPKVFAFDPGPSKAGQAGIVKVIRVKVATDGGLGPAEFEAALRAGIDAAVDDLAAKIQPYRLVGELAPGKTDAMTVTDLSRGLSARFVFTHTGRWWSAPLRLWAPNARTLYFDVAVGN